MKAFLKEKITAAACLFVCFLFAPAMLAMSLGGEPETREQNREHLWLYAPMTAVWAFLLAYLALR